MDLPLEQDTSDERMALCQTTAASNGRRDHRGAGASGIGTQIGDRASGLVCDTRNDQAAPPARPAPPRTPMVMALTTATATSPPTDANPTDTDPSGDGDGGGGMMSTLGGWVSGEVSLLGDGATAVADGAGSLLGGAADTGAALLNGFIAGDAGDGYDSGWLEGARSLGQLASGILIFGDVRDGGVAIGQLIDSGGRDGWLDLGLAAVGLVPVFGDLLKGAGGVARTADAVDDARVAGRALDDLADAGRAACSFAADTPVLMADGTLQRIDTVAAGDQVWAADPTTGQAGPRTVTAAWSHPDTLTAMATSAGT